MQRSTLSSLRDQENYQLESTFSTQNTVFQQMVIIETNLWNYIIMKKTTTTNNNNKKKNPGHDRYHDRDKGNYQQLPLKCHELKPFLQGQSPLPI